MIIHFEKGQIPPYLSAPGISTTKVDVLFYLVLLQIPKPTPNPRFSRVRPSPKPKFLVAVVGDILQSSVRKATRRTATSRARFVWHVASVDVWQHSVWINVLNYNVAVCQGTVRAWFFHCRSLGPSSLWLFALNGSHFSTPRLILARPNTSKAVRQCCFIT